MAAWVAALGGRARFIGKRARDPAGRILAEELRALGRGARRARGGGRHRHGRLRGDPGRRADDAERPRRLDRVRARGARRRPGSRAATGCTSPATASSRSPLRETAAGGRRARAARVSVDLSSTAAIAEVGVERPSGRRSPRSARTSSSPTRRRAELVGELDVETLAVKRGARGCVVVERRRRRELPAVEAAGRRLDRRRRRLRRRLPAGRAGARASTPPPAALPRWGRRPVPLQTIPT